MLQQKWLGCNHHCPTRRQSYDRTRCNPGRMGNTTQDCGGYNWSKSLSVFPLSNSRIQPPDPPHRHLSVSSSRPRMRRGLQSARCRASKTPRNFRGSRLPRNFGGSRLPRNFRGSRGPRNFRGSRGPRNFRGTPDPQRKSHRSPVPTAPPREICGKKFFSTDLPGHSREAADVTPGCPGGGHLLPPCCGQEDLWKKNFFHRSPGGGPWAPEICGISSAGLHPRTPASAEVPRTPASAEVPRTPASAEVPRKPASAEVPRNPASAEVPRKHVSTGLEKVLQSRTQCACRNPPKKELGAKRCRVASCYGRDLQTVHRAGRGLLGGFRVQGK